MIQELKLCPFCGGEAKIENVDSYKHPGERWWVLCDCGVIFSSGLNGSYQSEEEAFTAWNQRSERTCITITSPHGVHACSECGEHFSLADCFTELAEHPSYCPNCGAKVVE